MEPVSTPDYGRRLIASLVDDCAIETPQKTFAFVSRTSRVDDMQAISHYKFANAVNRCAFWMEELLGRGAHFDTVAYLGPSDLRTSIIILAAIKTGHKVPRNCHYFGRTGRLMCAFSGFAHIPSQFTKGASEPFGDYEMSDVHDCGLTIADRN